MRQQQFDDHHDFGYTGRNLHRNRDWNQRNKRNYRNFHCHHSGDLDGELTVRALVAPTAKNPATRIAHCLKSNKFLALTRFHLNLLG